MGASSGGKSTKNSYQTATTTPQLPDYAQVPIASYYNNYLTELANDVNPQQFVTPANQNQQAAFSGASGLNQSQPYYQTAANATAGLLNAPTPQAQLTQAQMAQLPAATLLNMQTLPQASAGQATASLAGPIERAAVALLGDANTVSLGGYTPGTLGAAQGYDAAQAQGTNLTNQTAQAQAQSLLTNLNDYLAPTTEALVNKNLSSFDTAAQELRAQQMRDAAKTGAFAGSNNAILQGKTERELANQRGLLEATLRDNAWTRAVGMSQYDTTNRQQAELANTLAANNRRELIAQLNQQTGLFNTGETNASRAAQALASNNFALARYGAENDAARFGADAANTGQLFNAGAQNDFLKTNAGAENAASLFNAGQFNDTSRTNAQLGTNVSIANANNQTSASTANAQLAMQGLLSNQNALNSFGLAGFNAANDFSQFNAGQANNLSQFNANLAQQGQQLDMNAANQLANIGSTASQDYINNLSALLNLGSTQWTLDNMATQAPLTFAQQYGQLLNPNGLLNTVTPTQITTVGRESNRQSGGLLGTLGSIASIAGAAASVASDRRLKRDIELIDREPDGLGRYSFRYIWDEDDAPLRSGVMADEVEQLRPWALGERVGDFGTVIYEAL